MTRLSMHESLPIDEAKAPSLVSTGELPQIEQVRDALTETYARYRLKGDGTVTDYISALAAASPGLFGISVVGARGRSFEIGDVDTAFSIQSVSKPFVFALVCDAIGYEAACHRLGVNSTGFPFNSLMAVPMVELLEYLTANGLATYIASGGGCDFMRPISQDVDAIPRERVIGSRSTMAYTSSERGGTITHKPEADYLDDGPEKPGRIWCRGPWSASRTTGRRSSESAPEHAFWLASHAPCCGRATPRSRRRAAPLPRARRAVPCGRRSR
jgi:Glutaminase